MKEVQLTDEQIDELVDVLHPKDNENNNDNGNYPYNVAGFNEKMNLKSEIANVELDPNTGMHKISPIMEKNIDTNYTDLVDNPGETENVLSSATEKELMDFGIPEEECLTLFNIINKYKNKENFQIYNELPNTVKEMVLNIAGRDCKNIGMLNRISKNILDFFINQMNIDQEFVDLQKAIDKELQFNAIADIYVNDQLLKAMEVDILKQAEALEEKGYKEKAESLRELSKTFSSTYKMERELEELDKNPKIVKILNKKLNKFNRCCMEFNYKYQDCKFIINDIKLLLNCLTKLMPERSIDEIKKFIILITEICKHLNPEIVIEHSFMYYTVKNILILEHLKIDSEFKKEVLGYISTVMDKIKELEK